MVWFKGTPGIYVCSCKDSQTGQIPLGQWARLGIRFGRADRCLENKHDLVFLVLWRFRGDLLDLVVEHGHLQSDNPFFLICSFRWSMFIPNQPLLGDLISRTLIEAKRGMPNSHFWEKTRFMLATQQQTTHILIGIPPIYGKIGNGAFCLRKN